VAERKKAQGKDPSFRKAVEEVEAILLRLEAEEVDIDDLSREVGRAVELIKLCRSKLEKTDSEVRRLVADLEAEPGTAAEDGAAPEAADPEEGNTGLPF
jgi:exodeoxyribonuclease VII small subunit